AGGSTGTDGVPHFPGKAAGTEIAAVYFPRTAVSKFEEFNRVQNLRVVGQQLMVVVAEGISEDASPGVVYELGFDLSPAAVTLTDNVKVRYREMVQRGLLPKGP
ncbi:MAG: hypothetical protein HYZ57_01645, partial [Acidobacteria bacterium]|nr:hypothetical protein [Acidobacteriota bacterium]